MTRQVDLQLTDTDILNVWRSVLAARLRTGQYVNLATTDNHRLYAQSYAPQRVISGVYGFNASPVNGETSSHNFLTLFNPSASTKLLSVAKIGYEAYTAGEVNGVDNPVTVYRVSTATGGSLQAASATCKLDSTYPNPTAEVRTSNPSATLGAKLAAFAPPTTGENGGHSDTSYRPRTEFDELVLRAGEGVVFRQDTGGDSDQRHVLRITWMEYSEA